TTTPATTPATTPTPPPRSGGWGITELGGHLSNVSPAHQQAANLVIVSEEDAAAAAALPGRSLVYMDGLIIRQDGGSGVPYAEAQSNGYLTGVNSSSYPGTFAKIDSPTYQQWFAQKAVALAQKYGVDGILLDDVSASGSTPYTPATQKPAVVALVQAVGSALHAAGLYLMTNTSGYEPGQPGSDDGSRDLAWWEQIAPNVDGIMTEYWAET